MKNLFFGISNISRNHHSNGNVRRRLPWRWPRTKQFDNERRREFNCCGQHGFSQQRPALWRKGSGQNVSGRN